MASGQQIWDVILEAQMDVTASIQMAKAKMGDAEEKQRRVNALLETQARQQRQASRHTRGR